MTTSNTTPSPSPKTIARTGGVLYLVIIVAGLFGEIFVRNKLIVSGDAAATAHNIMNSQFMWRMGIAGDLVMHLCDIGLMMVFYFLLRPVNKYLALTAVLFNLIQTAVLVVNKLNLLMPLFFLGDAEYLKTFQPDQLYTLAYLSVKAHNYGFGIGLIFFGLECLIIGYLILKSDYLPGLLGILLQIAGVCYLINSFALILSPTLSNMLYPFILIPSFIGELSVCLWLLIKGVNVAKWEQASMMK